jgi:hypothetical protein
MILSINTLCLLIAKSIIQIMDVNLNGLRRDLSFVIERDDSFSCHFRGYMFFSVVSALYWSCTLQAIFRFTRVFYPRCLWIHRPFIYSYILIPTQIIFAYFSVLPHLLVFDAMRLIPDEIYCTAIMNDFLSLMYLFLVVFGLPLSTIVICYFGIICRIRYSSFILSYQQRNRRDYIVIRRIMTIIVILSMASLPAVIDLIICVPRGNLSSLVYRIEWISASVNAFIFAITLPYINPELCKLFRKREVPKKPRLRFKTTENTIMM